MSHWLSDLLTAAHGNLGAGMDPIAVQARDYLHFRGVPHPFWAQMYLGAASDATPVERCSEDFLPFARRYWPNSLVFPFFGPRGELLGIQTRALGEKAYNRYDLRENAVYPLAYGGHLAWPALYEGAPLLLVEGIFDYFAVRIAFPEATVMATISANVSRTIRRWLARYATHVIVLFDNDEAGHRGADVLIRSLADEAPRTRCSRVVPVRHDPGEYLQVGDIDGLQRLLGRHAILGRHAPRATPPPATGTMGDGVSQG